jgi:hypothetical protein
LNNTSQLTGQEIPWLGSTRSWESVQVEVGSRRRTGLMVLITPRPCGRWIGRSAAAADDAAGFPAAAGAGGAEGREAGAAGRRAASSAGAVAAAAEVTAAWR